MAFANLFKRKPKQDKSCKNCKHYQPDDWLDNLHKLTPHISWGKTEAYDHDRFAKCNHPQARYRYANIERNTNWFDARALGTCSNSGRRFEPNIEGLANILRQK
jgi:hypothetical protein